MNSIDIDLLPWREALREQRRQRFYFGLGGVALCAALVVATGWWWLDSLLARQTARNHFLEQEIAQLDRQIAEIKSLESLIAGILARKEVIESLQLRRVEPIAVVDALPRLLPEGVALTQLERHDAEVTLRGLARSNGTVSELMRALESSPDFHRVRLIETQATEVDRQSGVQFALVVTIDRASIEQRTTQKEGAER